MVADMSSNGRFFIFFDSFPTGTKGINFYKNDDRASYFEERSEDKIGSSLVYICMYPRSPNFSCLPFAQVVRKTGLKIHGRVHFLCNSQRF